MQVGLPATLFFRGRFVQTWPNCDVDAVVREAERLDLYAFKELVGDILDDLRPPSGFRPRDWRHTPSTVWIETQRLGPMIRNTHEFQVAMRILKAPRPREFIDCALFINASTQVIAAVVREEYGFRVTPAELDTYVEFFHDSRRLTQHDWQTLHEMRKELWSKGTPTQQAWVTGLKRVRRPDPRRTMMAMPADKTSAQLAQLACGIRPQGFDLVAALDEVVAGGLYDLIQDIRVNGSIMAGPNRAAQLSMIRDSLGIKAEQAVPQVDVVKHFATVRTDTPRAPSISEITKGRHTLDIVKSAPALPEGRTDKKETK